MERFYFEIPGPERKEAAIDYINEFYQYNSDINGTGGLNRFLDDYEGWLEKLNLDYNRMPNEEKVPARTYFLVRESDRRKFHVRAGEVLAADAPALLVTVRIEHALRARDDRTAAEERLR